MKERRCPILKTPGFVPHSISHRKNVFTQYILKPTGHYNFLPFIWQFVPYKSLSVTWLESEPVMMLSAEREYSTWCFSEAEEAVCLCRVHNQGKVMNDAKCKRGLTVPSASITLVTTSAFTTKGGQVQARKCYHISSCSVLPCTCVPLSGPLADITILKAKRGQTGRNHSSLHVKETVWSPCLLCILATPTCSLFSTNLFTRA